MSIFSERNTKNAFIPKWVLIEHAERYWFANQFLKNKIVVDCACGTGIGTQIYAQSEPQKIYAFDISEDAVVEAKKNNDSLLVEISCSSATSLPIENSSVDVYVSFETIEHIHEDNEYLKEAARILKPNGIFICSTPNRSISNPGTHINQKPINPYHIREYARREFLESLNAHFTVTDVYGQNPKPVYVISFLNFLSKFLPHPIPARVHQVFKVLWYYMGLSHKNGIDKIIDKQDVYEFLIVISQLTKHS
jgi:SAM-dependent methyltransferase